MSRSTLKVPYCYPSLIKKIEKIQTNSKKQQLTIQVWSRASTILPSFVGQTFDVYNGQKFLKIKSF